MFLAGGKAKLEVVSALKVFLCTRRRSEQNDLHTHVNSGSFASDKCCSRRSGEHVPVLTTESAIQHDEMQVDHPHLMRTRMVGIPGRTIIAQGHVRGNEEQDGKTATPFPFLLKCPFPMECGSAKITT
eukprot:630939-Amphidinium_carterae.1